MWPKLDVNVDFDVWKTQFEAATKAKLFLKLTDDENANNAMISNFRLSLLPSVLSEEILRGCTDKFSLGTTTYNTGLQAVRQQWIRVTKPSDITAEINAIRIYTTEDIMPAWNSLQRLRYYTNFGDDFLMHQLINAIVDVHVKQTAQAFVYGKTLSPKEFVDFLLTVSFRQPAPVNVVSSAKFRCFNCDKPGHYARQCRGPRAKCTSCSREGHLTIFCRSSKNLGGGGL